MNGALAITFTDITAFLIIYPWFDSQYFARCIMSMDSVYLNYQAEQASRKKTSSNNNAPPPSKK